MAETPQNSLYAEGMKWVIALSVAAVAGAFTHLSDLSKLPFNWRIVGAVAVVAFTFAAFFGVHYLIQLWTSEERSRTIERIDAKGPRSKADDDEVKQLQKLVEESKKSRPKLYLLQTIFSCIAALLAIVFLPAAILNFHDDAKPPAPCCSACPQPQPQPAADRYAIVLSAIHPGRGGVMQHTFLLDKQTGRIWQMVCQKGGLVAFHEVPRIPAP